MHLDLKNEMEDTVKATVTIDDALYKQAMDLADPSVKGTSELVREALQTYIRVQAARRLAALGGKVPGMPDIPRRGDP